MSHPSHIRSLVLAALVLAATAAAPTALRAATLEEELLRHAPQVIQHLHDKGYRNVGVLKFHVAKGDKKLTDNAGTLNLSLAHRLEVALVLANPPDPKRQLGIIRDASKAAERLPGANHLTEAGCRKLFEEKYALGWKSDKVAADAFITGVAQLDRDLKQMTVHVMAMGKADFTLRPLNIKFTVPCSAGILAESGESFLLRGAFNQGQVQIEEEKAAAGAVQVKMAQQAHPLESKEAPVELGIRYDGRSVRPVVRDGQAEVPEPKEKQKVSFILKRTRGADPKLRYAVVLKVNGESTLFRERLPEADCTKWLLSHGAAPLEITGIQVNDKVFNPFRVLSRAESKANEVYYGADVGLITLVVFRERRPGDAEPPPLPLQDGKELKAITLGQFPGGDLPPNLAALQAQLRDPKIDVRGIVVPDGKQVQGEVKRVPVETAPVPVMTATIRYYKP